MSAEAHKERIIRITVVGDGYTGKTCMLIVYKDKKYDDTYIPTVFDSYSMNIPINEQEYRIILQDTAGQEDYDKLRTFAYKESDVFILCYAVDSIASYQNITKWNKELKHYAPHAKIILVGTKIDIREDGDVLNSRNKFLNFENGIKMKQKISATDFIECSSKKLHNVNKVFETAMLAGVKPIGTRYRKSECKLF